MTKTHVLFIINSLACGGAEKQTISLLNNLNIDQFKISLVCLKDNETLKPQIQKNKLRSIILCDIRKKINLSAIKRIASYIDSEQVDIVVCVNTYSMLYGLLAKKIVKKNPKVIVTFHVSIISELKERLNMVVYRWFLNKCDYVVFVSKNQENYWTIQKKIKPKKFLTIHNGIDFNLFNIKARSTIKKELLSELNITTNDYIIGICAVLRPEKKHEDAINAILMVKRRFRNTKLLIIGDGPERVNIEKHIKKVGLEKDVIITGYKVDVRPYISICDCMVITSHFIETFSIAALEAMALGKPMIMTDIGGATEQIEHGVNGFIYKKGDVKALADHIIQLNKISLREKFGQRAFNHVKQNFSLKEMVSKYEDLFLLASNRKNQ